MSGGWNGSRELGESLVSWIVDLLVGDSFDRHSPTKENAPESY
jgi:hypothetical protein